MDRISVTFYDEVRDKLKERMKQNNLKSLAHCIRELVDLALKVEEAAKKNDGKNNEEASTNLVEMLKNNLKWSLETRLLSRYLIENLPKNEGKNHLEILETYKTKAISYVDGMLKEGD